MREKNRWIFNNIKCPLMSVSLGHYEEVCHYKWTKFRDDLGVNGDKNLLRRQVVNMLLIRFAREKLTTQTKTGEFAFQLAIG